jgi:hypothetical protein
VGGTEPWNRKSTTSSTSRSRVFGSVFNTLEDSVAPNERGDHPIRFGISNGSKELRPWQAYASYFLTGGLVRYGQRGKGFVVDKVFGTREASPSHFDEARTSSDRAVFDPESAAASGQKDLLLGFTCVREW